MRASVRDVLPWSCGGGEQVGRVSRVGTYDVGQDADVPDAVGGLLQRDEALAGDDGHPGGRACFRVQRSAFACSSQIGRGRVEGRVKQRQRWRSYHGQSSPHHPASPWLTFFGGAAAAAAEQVQVHAPRRQRVTDYRATECPATPTRPHDTWP
jgi:hypothetical protein